MRTLHTAESYNSDLLAMSMRFLAICITVFATARPFTDIEFRQAVFDWPKPHVIQSFGHISKWDVSWVTNMTAVFAYKETFNEDISGWDVSSVTSMAGMFQGAKAFNQPIGGWDTSKVKSMASRKQNLSTNPSAVGTLPP